ncbi:MAG: T9SS type A sorting domain-containing protein [Ignavibacteriales bacterium]|nr:T9SS type A sorting domain-containing protein [Ignavibacteriales bacterium]
MSNAQYPVTIRAEGTELRLRDMASGGKLVNAILHSGEQCAINNAAVTSVEISALVNPVTYELLQNYPNPFNPSTTISFTIPEKAHVSLSVYNQLGQLVTTLFAGEKESGFHSVEWNAADVPSGVYFFTLKTEKFSSVKKLMLMK